MSKPFRFNARVNLNQRKRDGNNYLQPRNKLSAQRFIQKTDKFVYKSISQPLKFKA